MQETFLNHFAGGLGDKRHHLAEVHDGERVTFYLDGRKWTGGNIYDHTGTKGDGDGEEEAKT